MHIETIKEALIGSMFLFSTIFHIPEQMGMVGQIFSWLVVFGILVWLIETARDWEKRIKKRVRRAGTQTDK